MFNNGKFYGSFYGQTISDYGRKNGFVDYEALKNSFDAVLCNSILGYQKNGMSDWIQIHGFADNSEKIEELEAKIDDINEVLSNINDKLEELDDIESSLGDWQNDLSWKSFDFEDADGNVYVLDESEIDSEIDSISFYSIREELENHASDASEALEELEKAKDELEEEQQTTDEEIFQYYIISDSGKRILEENTNEIIFYNEELDLYVWGITHFGTGWDYVLTSIPCETYEEEEARKKAEAEAEEAYTTACIDDDERHHGCGYTKDVEATLDSIKAENASLVANVSQRINDALADEAREHGTDYLLELERLMKHKFVVGDFVYLYRDTPSYTEEHTSGRVIANDHGMLTIVDGDECFIANRFDAYSIDEKGEEIHTPCTNEELEKLKALHAWA